MFYNNGIPHNYNSELRPPRPSFSRPQSGNCYLVRKLGVDDDDGVEVWMGFDERGEYVSIRCIPCGSAVNRQVERDILTRRKLLHPHIVKLRKDGYLGIVLDFVPGRNLEFLLEQDGPLTECRARHFLQQITLAVDYCHKKGICVHTIRLDTLALTAGLNTIKLANFHLRTKSADQTRRRAFLVNCDYTAPEVLDAQGRLVYDGCAVDVWGIGVCFYVMIFGHFPFADYRDTAENRVDNTCRRIQNGEFTVYDFQINKQQVEVPLTDACVDLMRRLLETDRNQRITIEELISNCWFQQGLPEGALRVNDALEMADDRTLSLTYDIQSKARFKELLAQASNDTTNHRS